ncbi:Phosphopantothenoylcysteine decarboxylase [Blattella germanica]|nr:Phosphopantothenoylcysteine decarboxylase [Blattella germanica]
MNKHILIGCTGSVATIKLPLLLKSLLEESDLPWKVQVQVIVTEHAKHFYTSADIPSNVPVFSDQDEWSAWSGRGDPVLHIDLSKWADVFIIAPLDANTLAKLAQVQS